MRLITLASALESVKPWRLLRVCLPVSLALKWFWLSRTLRTLPVVVSLKRLEIALMVLLFLLAIDVGKLINILTFSNGGSNLAADAGNGLDYFDILPKGVNEFLEIVMCQGLMGFFAASEDDINFYLIAVV